MNFNTAFENPKEEIIDDRIQIIKNYLTGWFIVDFVSVFPIDLVFMRLNYYTTLDNINRFLRLFRFFRLFSLREIHHLKPSFDYI